VREHLGWWATTKYFFRLHNLPEMIRQKISQTAQIFSSMRIFPECPKCLGMNEKHLQHLQGVHNYWAKFLKSQNVQFFWADTKNSTFITFQVMLKFLNSPKNFQASWNKSLVNLFEHKICRVPKTFSRNEKFSTSLICQKLVERHKKS
jgi:hypothetical protein